jgi:hypothetical protein
MGYIILTIWKYILEKKYLSNLSKKSKWGRIPRWPPNKNNEKTIFKKFEKMSF